MKDAIARNYDAVEDGGELFQIAVRRSGSFCQAGRLDAQQSLSARSVGNLILRLGSLFEPSPHIHICPGQPTRGLCMFTSEQHRPRATARGELVKGSQR